MTHTCPVCGYPDLFEPPRSSEGGGSYEICHSCGFEYGYTDDALHISYDQWRKKWLQEGMLWYSVKPQPKNWNPKKQLLNIGVKLP